MVIASRRLVTVVALLLMTLAGCGSTTVVRATPSPTATPSPPPTPNPDATVTEQVSGPGGSLQVVITGPRTNLDSEVAAMENSLRTSGADFSHSSGDHHTGAMVCTTDVSDISGAYHIAIYSDSPDIPATICQSIKQAAGG